MAGILFESIASCRRAAYCLRFMRVSSRTLVLCPAPHFRSRNFSISSDSGDEKDKDRQQQLTSIQVGKGLGPSEKPDKGSGGLEVTAAPHDPKDIPGEKRTEVNPEIPLGPQPSRNQPKPLEVKPSNPQTITCTSSTSENEVLEAAKEIDTIESEAKLDNTLLNESSTKSGLKSNESSFHAIESELHSQPGNDPKNQDVSPSKSELTCHSSSSNDSKTESKDDQNSQVSHLSKEDPQTDNKESAPSKDLKVQPHSKKADDISEQSSRQEGKTVDSGCSVGSSFDLPGEDKVAKQLSDVDSFIYSSAQDGYGSQYGQMSNRYQKKIGSESVDTNKQEVDDEVIDQWVDKFKQFYIAEKAAFGLDNEHEDSASIDEKDGKISSSVTNDKKDEKALQTMVKINNVWVLRDSDTAKTPTPSETGLSETTTDKSNSEETLPLKIAAQHESSTDEENRAILVSASNNEKDEKTLVSKNNMWLIRKHDDAATVSYPSEAPTTDESSPERTLPLNIVAKREDPTDFGQSGKALPGSEIGSFKDANSDARKDSTKPNKLVLDQTPAVNKSEDPVSELAKSSEEINKIDQKKSARQTTEEIVAMFEDDVVSDLSKTEESRAERFFDTLDRLSLIEESESSVPESTKDSQSEVLAMSGSKSEEKYDSDDYFLKSTEEVTDELNDELTEVKSIITDAISQENMDDSEKDDFFLKSSEEVTDELNDELTEVKSIRNDAISQENMDDSEKDVFFLKSTEKVTDESTDELTEVKSIITQKDEISQEIKDDSEKEGNLDKLNDLDFFLQKSELEESMNTQEDEKSEEIKDDINTFDSTIKGDKIETINDDMISKPIGQETEFNQKRFDLAEKVASFIKASKELYDGKEVQIKKESGYTEAPEIESKVNEKTPDAEEAVKDKPVLDDGELSMKLLDKASEKFQSTEAGKAALGESKAALKESKAALKESKAALKESKAALKESKEALKESKEALEEGSAALAAPSHTSVGKGFLEKFFDKIFGMKENNDGKRKMSTYTVQRQLSSCCTSPVPPSPVRTLARRGSVNELICEIQEKIELKAEHDSVKMRLQVPVLQPPTIELFAKDTKDLTEIKGGSPICKSPKSPRELMQEKKNSKKIKILGGSEECAKKMKRLKELTNDTKDPCGRDHFSISLFLRKLRMQQTTPLNWTFVRYGGVATGMELKNAVNATGLSERQKV